MKLMSCVALVALSVLSLPLRADEADATAQAAAIAKLENQVKDLTTLIPSQGHAMVDVAYHFGNLWFAARAGNWPLAQFYLNETKAKLRWAVRIRPVRPVSGGGELKLADLLDALEKSTLKELQDSVTAKDRKKFESNYATTLASCQGCHVASEKGFIRLRIPDRAPEPLVEMKPAG
jgi:hypothetical protein